MPRAVLQGLIGGAKKTNDLVAGSSKNPGTGMDKGGWMNKVGSEIKKLRKKVKKTEKKVLTFSWKFDKIHKLTRAGHRRAALNLENDTE